MMALAPIFPSQNYDIFGCVLSSSFTFNLYWVRVASAVKIAKESVAIQTGRGKEAYKIEGTS